MNSQQRRFERYRILYIWKVLEGLAPNCGIEESNSDRAGRQCSLPKIKAKTRHKIKTLRNQSFQIHDPQLFNTLPKHHRNIKRCSVPEFKEKLDQYLTLIPYQPIIGNLIPSTCDLFSLSPSNSLIDQIREFRARGSRFEI